MARTTNTTYSMPRGDSRSITIAIPVATYSTGSSIFFALKTAVDNILDDSTAVLKKTLTDANITSNDGTNVNYLLELTPEDTTVITPATYRAEFEFVNAAAQTSPTDPTGVVISFPDPGTSLFYIEITGDINRRITNV